MVPDLNSTLASAPAYLLLAIAIVAEVAATTSLKLAAGFTRPLPLLVVAVGYGIALILLSAVLERMPVGTVYAIWAGCGVAGVALTGALLFGERIGLRELAGFVFVVAGVALLSARPGTY